MAFVEGWLLAHTLGEGAYGEVKLVINNATGEAVAMKMIDLRKHPDASTSVRKETAIQRSLRHANILQYYGKRSHAHFEYIFLEYCSGGELFDRIEPDVGMPAKDARRYFRQLLSGVEYLHSKGVAHRDLKPENLLLDQFDNLKISDFGMATMFKLRGAERMLDRRCGTLPYVAPEVLTGTYKATPADLWSCGIILVTMLVGELPWDQPSPSCKEFKTWSSGSVIGAGGLWQSIAAGPLGLLKNLLAPEPDRRPTIQRLQLHHWLSHQISDDDYINDKRDLGVCLSQPLPSGDHTASLLDRDVCAKEEPPCFSQPVVSDDLLLGTQLNPTQSTVASQSVFQKLVKRMTRFFVNCDWAQAVERLGGLLRAMQCQWKITQAKGITITTMDSRKMHLVFKANLIDMNGKLLIDFRLSKGCGLEFKRRFVQIKNGFSDVIVNCSISTIIPDVPIL